MGPLGHSVAALTALVGAPLLGGALLLRPRWRTGLPERLGAHPAFHPAQRPIWVHAASVGEVTAALPLLDALCAHGHAVVLSTMTTTGRAVARTARPALETGLAPLDHPWTAARALARVRPRALVFVETELWPSWVRAADEREIPTLVVSGRLSERSFVRWQRARAVLRPTLARYTAIAARSEADAARFVALGAAAERVSVCGDLKLDAPGPRPADPALVAFLGTTPLVVAGSTHEGEEAAVLAALDALERAGRAAALVIAPRHPERFERAAQIIRAAGRPLHRRSGALGGVLAAGEVLLLDTLGELASLYALADVAFVGGTLVSIGGHNVLEPALAGCAVLFGPHFESSRESAALLLAAGAAQQVRDAAGLAAAVIETLATPAEATARGARGRAALAAHRGATERSLALIERVLGAAP